MIKFGVHCSNGRAMLSNVSILVKSLLKEILMPNAIVAMLRSEQTLNRASCLEKVLEKVRGSALMMVFISRICCLIILISQGSEQRHKHNDGDHENSAKCRE